jgi:hypothetical protein
MTSQLKVDRISPATGSEIIIDGFGGGEGSVIQLAKAVFPDQYSVATPLQSATPGYAIFPNVEVSITPKQEGSTFIVIFSGLVTHVSGKPSVHNIERSGTGISTILLDDYRSYGGSGNTASMVGWTSFGATSIHFDEPNTANTVTYKMTASAQDAGSSAYINFSGTVTAATARAVSRMMVMEVAG